jgi:hypothetical protein
MSALKCQFVPTASQHIWKDAVIASMGRCGKGEGGAGSAIDGTKTTTPIQHNATTNYIVAATTFNSSSRINKNRPKKKGVLE